MININDLQQALIVYAKDTENAENNFNVAIEYEKLGHTAPALSYFLRCAERTDDDLLAYEALIHGAICYQSQGGRDMTAKTLYQHAILLLPERPEAYGLLSRFCSDRSQWQDSYIYSLCGLTQSENTYPNLRYDCGYHGKIGLSYEYARSSWQWGKVEQSINTLYEIYESNHDEYSSKAKEYLIDTCKKWDGRDTKTIDFKEHNFVMHDIVLQGPIDEITGPAVDEYLNLPFVNKIIVSTWKDYEFEYDHPKVSIIKSEYPLVPGTSNKNLQIASTLAGLRECSSEYSIKMRADQKYNYDSMILLYDHFLKYGGLDGEKMFTAGIYPHLLYHPRDHVFWSTTSNLLKMFDIPLEYNSLADKIRLEKFELFNYYEHFTRPETYLAAHYLSKFDDRIKMSLIYPEKNLYDNCENWQENYELSLELMPKHFEVFPAEGIQMEWPKRLKKRIPGEPEYTFFDPKIHMKGEKHFEDSPWIINP
jgi:hypothetical protein